MTTGMGGYGAQKGPIGLEIGGKYIEGVANM